MRTTKQLKERARNRALENAKETAAKISRSLRDWAERIDKRAEQIHDGDDQPAYATAEMQMDFLMQDIQNMLANIPLAEIVRRGVELQQTADDSAAE